MNDTAAKHPAAADLRSSMVSGSLWMIALRWSMRGIGLISTIVLARLLTPDDFGLVAMAMLLVGLVEVFGQTGQILALIRHPSPTRDHFDTVWTISVLIGLAITVVLCLVAPAAPSFFNEPRAAAVVWVLSLRALIGGFENIGVVAFRKDLDFAREFRFQLAQRVITFATTLGLALWLRDYRALVAGILIGRILGVALSYKVHPYRPRFSLAKMGEIFSFSAWMLIVHVSQFVQDKADEFVVGATSPAADMGSYNVAADCATAPTVELVLPMTRALFPIFSKLSDRPEELGQSYLGVLASVAVLCCAASTGMAVIAEDFIAVVLGKQWMRAVPLIQFLALAGGVYSLMQGALTLISAAGLGRLTATLAATRAIATLLAVVAAGIFGDLTVVAQARLGISVVIVPGIFLALTRLFPISLKDILACVWRPLLAAAAMAMAVKLAHPAGLDLAAARLAIDVAVGTVVFPAVLFLAWVMAGCPSGVERSAIEILKMKFRGSISPP